MLLFLADLPIALNASVHPPDVDPAVWRAYHYALLVRSVYDYYVPILIATGLLCNIAGVATILDTSNLLHCSTIASSSLL